MHGKFTDSRDGKTYNTVKMPDGKRWMTENLNYETGGSWCYNNSNANCEKYGRLYNWNTAMRACPAGFRLPNNADWANLMTAVGGSASAGRKLKSRSGWRDNRDDTDDYGFSALPGGYRGTDGYFWGVGSYGYWWSATEYGASNASRYMYCGGKRVSSLGYRKGGGFSVRCLSD